MACMGLAAALLSQPSLAPAGETGFVNVIILVLVDYLTSESAQSWHFLKSPVMLKMQEMEG